MQIVMNNQKLPFHFFSEWNFIFLSRFSIFEREHRDTKSKFRKS